MNLYIIPWGINLISALVVFVLGRWLAKLIVKALSKVMKRANVDETL
ncbi:membrane protein, partial [Kaarinaea lacus]